MNSKQPLPINILVADDDKNDRLLFDMALKEIPLATRLKTVSDGEKLMDYLSKNSENLPDVIFLDLNMPRKNGSECLKEIKKNEKLKRLPVIIYSTSLRENIADVLFQNGAHYYLPKCNYNMLIKHIYKTLTLLAEDPNQPARNKFMLSL